MVTTQVAWAVVPVSVKFTTAEFAVTAPTEGAVMSEQPVMVTEAPCSKPEPVKVTESLEAVIVPGTAEGLTSWMPLFTLKASADDTTEPPSGLATVMVYPPKVATAELAGFVGVTLNTIEVPSGLTEVTEDVRPVPTEEMFPEGFAPPLVPSPSDANVTVAPVSKPLPLRVTVFAPVPS